MISYLHTQKDRIEQKHPFLSIICYTNSKNVFVLNTFPDSSVPRQLIIFPSIQLQSMYIVLSETPFWISKWWYTINYSIAV